MRINNQLLVNSGDKTIKLMVTDSGLTPFVGVALEYGYKAESMSSPVVDNDQTAAEIFTYSFFFQKDTKGMNDLSGLLLLLADGDDIYEHEVTHYEQFDSFDLFRITV